MGNVFQNTFYNSEVYGLFCQFINEYCEVSEDAFMPYMDMIIGFDSYLLKINSNYAESFKRDPYHNIKDIINHMPNLRIKGFAYNCYNGQLNHVATPLYKYITGVKLLKIP